MTEFFLSWLIETCSCNCLHFDWLMSWLIVRTIITNTWRHGSESDVSLKRRLLYLPTEIKHRCPKFLCHELIMCIKCPNKGLCESSFIRLKILTGKTLKTSFFIGCTGAHLPLQKYSQSYRRYHNSLWVPEKQCQLFVTQANLERSWRTCMVQEIEFPAKSPVGSSNKNVQWDISNAKSQTFWPTFRGKVEGRDPERLTCEKYVLCICVSNHTPIVHQG